MYKRQRVLGDDQTILGHLPRNVPYVEEDLDDTKSVFILGMSYLDDPLRPRLNGIKVQSDRSDLGIPLKPTYEVTQRATLMGHHSTAEIATWCGAFLGWFGGDRSLIEAIRDIDLHGLRYLAPSTIIDALTTHRNTKDDEHVDLFSWTERYGTGIRKLFTTGTVSYTHLTLPTKA